MSSSQLGFENKRLSNKLQHLLRLLQWWVILKSFC